MLITLFAIIGGIATLAALVLLGIWVYATKDYYYMDEGGEDERF
jgi:hypothetical protein